MNHIDRWIETLERGNFVVRLTKAAIMIGNMLQIVPRFSLLTLFTAYPFQLMAADELAAGPKPKVSVKEPSLPPVIGPLPQEPNAAFHYSAWQEGIRIGISSESTEYHLNHRINVWECVEPQHPRKFYTLMSNDPIYKDGSLRITGPDGKTRACAFGGPIDGIAGSGWMGGESGNLHAFIRQPGKYTLQLFLGKRRTNPVSFTVLP